MESAYSSKWARVARARRLIDRILETRPHLARSACRPDRGALAAVLGVLGDCIAHRIPVDLGNLYDTPGERVEDSGHTPSASHEAERLTVRVEVGLPRFKIPPLPSRHSTASTALKLSTMKQQPHTDQDSDFPSPVASRSSPGRSPSVVEAMTADAGLRQQRTPDRARFGGNAALSRPVHDAEAARMEAHRAFLRLAEGTTELMARHLAYQLNLIDDWTKAGENIAITNDGLHPVATGEIPTPAGATAGVLFDRGQCLQLAVGSLAAVFGPEFAEVDRLPVRVRLPDEPLMLVDRILAIEGTPRSLEGGRIVTEHVVRPEAWYLEQDRAAPSVSIEAGQADLILSGYLGVDFETRGLATYRLLDATVTFHRRLPAVGDVIRYDIRITQFFRQGKTILFRFQFDATVAGEPLLSMRDGCAGFFTPEDLASGKGIVPGGLLVPTKSPSQYSDEHELIPTSPCRLDKEQVEALRRGDLATAFESPFDRLTIEDPITLPGGLMTLIHRVVALEPSGGPAGLGRILAEADVHPGDWYMVCHFIDDRVMPGTLMYEGCLHALRILLMRLGWIGRQGQAAFEPVTGIANRLRCRGQIIESTRLIAYEITIKERGYRPEPYAIADALIYADGKPIVSVTDMALQLSGTNRGELEQLWRGIATLDPKTSPSEPTQGGSPDSDASGPVHSRPDPGLRGGKTVGCVRRALSAVRRRAIPGPAPRPSLSIHRSDHA